MEMIELKNICKSYGDKAVYHNFSIAFEDGKRVAMLGESGTGKTTLINVLSGLTDYSGEIVGKPQKASVVFQKDRLVPNLTVKENILLVNKNADVSALLETVELKGCEDSYIKSLSGGMARRVAIARALAYSAPLLLLDEPFINLDLALKLSLIAKIKGLTEGKTVVAVLHDIKEAILLADRIVVLANGKIVYDNSDIGKDTEAQLFEVMTNLKKY